MNGDGFMKRIISGVLLIFGLLLSSPGWAFSIYDGVCGDAWIFVPGKYKKYYEELYKKLNENREQCRQYGSMSDASFACGKKVQAWYDQKYAEIQAQEKADGEAYTAKRQQCIDQAKAQDDQKKVQEAAQRQQEQLQRQAYNDAMARSNAERDAYNQAAAERNQQAQAQYANQQRIYAAQQAEANRQAQIQAQQQAAIAAEQARKESEFRGAVHDLQMQSLQQDAQDSADRYAAAAARNESVDEKYKGEPQQLSSILEQVRAKAAAKLAAAREAVTGDQPVLRADVGEVVASTLTANAVLNNQNPISNGLTAAAVIGMGEVSSSSLNHMSKALDDADKFLQSNTEKLTTAAPSTSTNSLNAQESSSANTTVEITTREKNPESRYEAELQQSNGSAGNSESNISAANTTIQVKHDDSNNTQHVESVELLTSSSSSVLSNHAGPEQTVLVQQDQAEASTQCATPNMATIQADLPPYALASLHELRNRLNIAISNYTTHCKNDPAYQQMLTELNQAREQTQKACDQLTSGGKCE